MKRIVCCLLGLLALSAGAETPPPAWTESASVAASSFSVELPVEVLATKLYVEVEIGGEPRRMVVDTGSPSMLSAAVAAELGLEVVGRQEGRDSHGVRIVSDIVQADLTMDGVVFRRVPMFVADFSVSPAAECLLGDGVLGSELLPLCAWQIDLPDGVVRCRSEAKALEHVRGAETVRLHDFGYPHLPFFDVRFADDAVSKAMFDTGSSEVLTISPPDFEGARKAGAVGRTISGFGSLGASLGGRAPDGDRRQAELETLSIGPIELGPVVATVRESPPSLVGASVLEHFVVTLDARSETAYFDEYRKGPSVRPSFGFGLAFEEDAVSISLVWDGSPAARAGLEAGQRLRSINGVATTTTCEGIRGALLAMSGERLEIAWDGGTATLHRASASADAQPGK